MQRGRRAGEGARLARRRDAADGLGEVVGEALEVLGRLGDADYQDHGRVGGELDLDVVGVAQRGGTS